MGRAVAPTNHGAAAPQRHPQAVSHWACAYCPRLHLPIGKTGKSEIPITFSKKKGRPYFWK